MRLFIAELLVTLGWFIIQQGFNLVKLGKKAGKISSFLTQEHNKIQ